MNNSQWTATVQDGQAEGHEPYECLTLKHNSAQFCARGFVSHLRGEEHAHADISLHRLSHVGVDLFTATDGTLCVTLKCEGEGLSTNVHLWTDAQALLEHLTYAIATQTPGLGNLVEDPESAQEMRGAG